MPPGQTFLSVAMTVKGKVPPAVGVPEMRPLELRFKPAESVPLRSVNE